MQPSLSGDSAKCLEWRFCSTACGLSSGQISASWQPVCCSVSYTRDPLLTCHWKKKIIISTQVGTKKSTVSLNIVCYLQTHVATYNVCTYIHTDIRTEYTWIDAPMDKVKCHTYTYIQTYIETIIHIYVCWLFGWTDEHQSEFSKLILKRGAHCQ